MWVATDQNGDKWLFEKKPERTGKEWNSDDGDAKSLDEFPYKDNLPSFVQQQEWKDAPIQVKFELKKK